MDNRIQMQQKASEPATLEMELTPEMEKCLKGEPFFLEIEMLQGEKQDLPDGRVRYTLIIQDQFKIDLIKEFVLKLISSSHDACLS